MELPLLLSTDLLKENHKSVIGDRPWLVFLKASRIVESGGHRVAEFLYPSSLSARLEPSQLHGQFVLAAKPEVLPARWSRYKIGDLWLACHSRLPVITIPCDQSGATVIIVGFIVDGSGGWLNGSSGLVCAASLFDAVERYLHCSSGRFVCIASDGSSIRLYPDASGSLAVLFAARYQSAASTIHLFPVAGNEDDRAELIESIDIAHNSKAFVFGLTPRRSISRLLPNHYLDLQIWTACRFWPRQPIAAAPSLDSALEDVSALMRVAVEAFLTAGYRPWMSLTAGYDSRALLAVSKPFVQRIRWFTWELPDKTGRQDVLTASRLAAVHRLDHYVFAYRESSGQEQRQWLLRAGLSVGENRGKSLVSTVESMGFDAVYLPGLAAEVGWGNYSKKRREDVPLINALVSMARDYTSQSEDQLQLACAEWMAGVPAQSDLNLLSLFYLEQRLGCWAGVTAYGHAKGPSRIHPYSNRRLFELLLGLPMEVRSNKNFLVRIIQRCWPELLDLPFA